MLDGSEDGSAAARHDLAVDRLVASYARLPPGSPVRLAKRASNLFRPRETAGVTGLDVSGLDQVLHVDTLARTAEVQGMCTYERLVAATLPYGLMPLVVPQLRSITLGGAVSGLGIESSSFHAGLPHESVLDLDIMVGSGEVVTARPYGEHADLFAMFPNSYGSLGYATRLRVELAPVAPYVALEHIGEPDLDRLADLVAQVVETGAHGGRRVDFVDGVVFGPGEAYLTLGRFSEHQQATSDYTGQQAFYRSICTHRTDALTTEDYLWRWDTDWFWCSGAFGLQHPLVRRVWPRRWRRSDVYHRLVGLEHQYGVAARIDRMRGLPARERVVQDVEVPVERLAEFLTFLDSQVGMRPVWLCPLRLREPSGAGASARTWPAYPLQPGRTYVNVGFWGTVPITAGAADGDVNRAVERQVSLVGGHKSLYSDVYYDRAEFDALYDGAGRAAVRKRYDPEGRLTGLYEKAVHRR